MQSGNLVLTKDGHHRIVVGRRDVFLGNQEVLDDRAGELLRPVPGSHEGGIGSYADI